MIGRRKAQVDRAKRVEQAARVGGSEASMKVPVKAMCGSSANAVLRPYRTLDYGKTTFARWQKD